MLEWSLKSNISNLKFAGAICGNKNQMDARVLRSNVASEFLTLMCCPNIKYEDDVCVGCKPMTFDAALTVGHDDLFNVLLHCGLVAPMVIAEGEMDLRCNRLGRTYRESTSCLASEDELERQQLAT